MQVTSLKIKLLTHSNEKVRSHRLSVVEKASALRTPMLGHGQMRECSSRLLFSVFICHFASFMYRLLMPRSHCPLQAVVWK